MCHCIETIRIEGGRVWQLDYHQRRLDATRRELFPDAGPLDLRDAVPSALPSAGVYRLRVTYAEALERVELEPYRRRTVRTLACVYVDCVDYRFKWADRRELQRLLQQRGDADEIIIVRDGLVTDSSYSNLALFGGNRWVTPDSPLLAGTMRARLLDQRTISEAPVPIEELVHYTHVALINALNPLGALVVPLGAVRL
ncbi:MAG: hypothetical protein EA384_10020 [Spirochaetaceae bacterium]|nr:MAG: hypothetical protein EA384_10020 [Spirochaetaceae bacterium]